MPTRINKYFSELGICSRREADRKIERGEITINGRVAVMGDTVEPTDTILLNGKPIKTTNKMVYLVLNKPKGITSTTDQSDPTNIVDFVNYPTRIFHVGRLDKDSEGLILLTNDGDIVNKILRSENNHEKEYEVVVDKKISNNFIYKMQKAVEILGTITKPAVVEKISDRKFRIILTEGLNRQIRRMCAKLNYKVYNLRRVRIMHITDKGLPIGKWRYLTKKETEELHRQTSR